MSRAAGDKSRFVKELEEALLAGEIDLAVHSAKDVPGELPEGLAIVGVPERADPRDALCGAAALDALPEGASVGTASVRRRAQLLALRPDLEVRELRGNVDTRLRGSPRGDFDAIVLAQAGLARLGRAARASRCEASWCPAPGQGCLALEARAGDDAARGRGGPDRSPGAGGADRRARAGGRRSRRPATRRWARTRCTPASALRLHAFVGLPDGSHWIRDELDGDAERPGRAGPRGGRAPAGRRARPSCWRAPSRWPAPVTRSRGEQRHRLPGRRRARRPRADDAALARADRGADAILYDRLIPAGALDGARADAELRYVGKEPGAAALRAGGASTRCWWSWAAPGKRVVRLKGGDPFVFGRGGEEAEALAAAGVPFEVVPGVTAGVAAPAYAGIPVTHRDAASAVAFVTGHEDPAKDETALDWEALARFPGTLVLYMGVKNLPLIAERLIGGGPRRRRAGGRGRARHPARPADGGRRRWATSPSAWRTRASAPPAITVVGPGGGAARDARLARAAAAARRRWWRSRARARRRASWPRGWRALGAEVVEAPAIRIEPRAGGAAAPLERLRADLLHQPQRRAAASSSARATATRARSPACRWRPSGRARPPSCDAHGIRADVVPERFVAEGLLEALTTPLEGKRVLVARAAEARDVLPDGLRERGAEVDVLALYDTVAEPLDEQLEALSRATHVTFTSSSTVRFFLEAAAGRWAARAWSRSAR